MLPSPATSPTQYRDDAAGVVSRFASPLLWALVAVALACFLGAIAFSWRWRVVHDASIMHYVVFLMEHGRAPYRDIVDINMPGAYMAEWLAVHTFGWGDLGWRLFDIASMFVAVAACCAITIRQDWRSGLLAGLCLSLAHMADGAIEIGQRDWTMMVLLLMAYASLFAAMRRQQPRWMLLFGLASGAAASLKPLAVPIPFVLLLLAYQPICMRGQRFSRYFAWGCAGAAITAVAVLAFLVGNHATAAFFGMTRQLVAYYTGVGNMPYSLMAQLALGRYILLLLLVATGIGIFRRFWRDPEQQMLFAGILFGAALYFGQHKGWGYHRLTLVAFVLLWICMQSVDAMTATAHRWLRWAGAAVLVLLMLYAGGKWTRDVRTAQFDEVMQTALRAEIERQGGSALSGSVQCLENGNGCITDLYRMRLVQSTGFLSDFFLFNRQPAPGLDALRTRLMEELAKRPPRVIVIVASDWAGGPAEFQPLTNWPTFSAWLAQHYRMVGERLGADGAIERGSYRVYRLQ